MQRPPRVALLDIETAPNLAWVWGKWEQNVLDFKIPSYFLSFAWKWQDEKRIKTYALPDYPLFSKDKSDDRALIKDLHNLVDQADIIIAHNGDKFDLRKSNSRFLIHALNPPSPYKSIDTLKIARKHFGFDSNKLDDLAAALGIGRKLPHTGFHLWRRCMEGCPKAWAKMRKYNAHDVFLLQGVYEKLRPWAANHPDLRIYDGRDGCPSCRSLRVQRRGVRVALKRVRQSYQCQDCAHWFSGEIVKVS